MAQANVKLVVDSTQATRSLQAVQNKTKNLNAGIGRLRGAIASIGIGLLAKNAIQTSASFEKLNVRLGLLTKANGTFARSQEIAAEAQKLFGLSATEALEGITNITARLQPLGVGVEDIRTTFIGFNTAAKLAGASAMESSAAFRQLAQALGSGRLQGDEFRSIAEQVPTILAPIAAELGTTVGGLKQFASEGKLTSDVVIRALKKVELDGAASLKALLENDPTQVFKNFSNATEDLSRAFGDLLKPAALTATKELTKFVTVVTEFVQTDAGQATLLIVGIAAAAKALAVAVPIAGAAVVAFTAKIAALKIAVLGLSGAIAATGIGAFVIALGALTTQIIKTKREQNELNQAIMDGSEDQVTEQLNKQLEIQKKLEERLKNANGRTKVNLENKIKEVEADIRLLEGRRTTLESDQLINDKLIERNELLNQNGANQDKNIQKTKEQNEELKRQQGLFTQITDNIASGVSDALVGAIEGTRTLGEAARSIVNNLASDLLRLGVNTLLKRSFGGIFSNLPGLANGGSAQAGRSYLVGERGPEIFTPKRSGVVIPNNQISSGSSGGIVNNINVNVSAEGMQSNANEDRGKELGVALASAIQSELIKQKRPGGLLAT